MNGVNGKDNAFVRVCRRTPNHSIRPVDDFTKMLKATDFKFYTHVPRDDIMTSYKFSKRRGWSRDPLNFCDKC